MSLIQEALRRKAEETQPPSSPAAPPPARRSYRLWPVFAGFALLWLAAGGAALYWLRARLARGPVEVVAPVADRSPLESERVEDIRPPEPVLAEGTAEEMAPVAEPPAGEEMVAVELPPADEPPVVVEEPPLPPPPPVVPEKPGWPAIKLLGVIIGADPDQPASALLNNQMIEVGESLLEVKLADVESAGAWLEYRGEKRFLKVGQSLP